MTQRNIIVSTPLYEILDERHAPHRPSRRRPMATSVGSIVHSFRGLMETGYVALAGGAMLRAERLEDVRAERAFASRRRKAERKQRRQERGGD